MKETITVDRSKKLTSLIDSCKFDWVNSNIEKFFTSEEIRGTDYRLFQFDKSISSEKAIEEIRKEGYFPANLNELLTWYPKWDGEKAIVALGSTARVGRCVGVPCLVGDDAGRDLGLFRWDGAWPVGWRLLGVRAHSLESQKSDLVLLESLTLRVQKLEDIIKHHNLGI